MCDEAKYDSAMSVLTKALNFVLVLRFLCRHCPRHANDNEITRQLLPLYLS